MPRLLLFDIDGTLVDTKGAGLAALLDAVEDCFGVARETVPPLDLAGATDGSVTRWLFEELGRPATAASRERYLECYLGHLQRRLVQSDFGGISLPGVTSLVAALAAEPGVYLGLLTGNVRDGAVHKLTRFGLAAPFVDGAFGDDAEDRNELGPIAIRRFTDRLGRAIAAEEVIIIGDTTRDIACAAACGARCVAVATGSHPRSLLEAHKPWRCLDDLADTPAVMELLAVA